MTAAMRQLPLDLGHRPALGMEDFLIAPSNQAAVAWLDRWPDWPASGLAIHGPAGSGKTHLAHVFTGASGGRLLDGATLAGFDLHEDDSTTPAFVVDDADRCADEEALLHLYNWLRETGRHLLLTARTPPARWRVRLADLGSRLNAMPSVPLSAPDDRLLEAVLVKLFHDRQLAVGQDVVAFTVARVDRSFRALRDFVAAADRIALARRRPVTIATARDALGEIASTQDQSMED